MLIPRIIRDCIIVSASMLVLASVSSVSERQITAPAAGAIGGENAQELECVVCMVELGDEELFICAGSGSNPHALHRTCLKRSKLKHKDQKKVCPGCTKNWKTQLMNIRTKAVKDLLMQSKKFKDAPESVNKILHRTPGAAELKEILAQMAGNFEELSPIHEQFQNICKRLLETYVPVSRIYDGASGESALEKTISGMDDAFEEFKEDKIRELPLKEGCQLLVDAPKNIYTANMIFFMSTPMFFAQLDHKQIVDLEKRLFTFARDDASFEETLTPFFAVHRVYYNSDALNSNAFGELLDLTECPTKLEEIQISILKGLRGYGTNVRLFPDCCEKLAKIVLTNSRIRIIERLFTLHELGFFTDFTKEMRGRVIDYWRKRGIKKNDERALVILHLKDSNIKPERNSNEKAFKLLKRIQKGKGDREMLQLEFYCNMLTCLPDDSFFKEIGKLILPIRVDLTFFNIFPFLPSGELEQRESIVFKKPKGCRDKIYLLTGDIVYLYSGVPFDAAFNSFFAFVARAVDERKIWTLELAAIHFGLFSKKDLGDSSNAKLFFDELKKNDLYPVMPLFKKYFVEIPEYEIYIANNMGNIIKNIRLIEFITFVQQILWALCDTQNEKVHVALCKHFPEYLQEVLKTSYHPLFPYMLLQRIFTESGFSENIEPAQIREMIIAFATHRETKPLFGRYMDIFSSCVDARTAREANAIEREIIQSLISNNRACDKCRAKSL